MRVFTISTATIALLFAGAAPSAAVDGAWKIDPGHSNAEFAIKHFALSTVRGTIPVKDGSITLSAASDIPSSVTATLDLTAIDTKNSDRDADLRSDHWFDVAAYPTGRFASTQISGSDPANFSIAGNLTLHGVTKPVTLQAELEGKGVGGRGEKRVAFSATAVIHRRDFALSNSVTNATGDLVVGEDAKISIEIEAIGP
jgi:polyisoprenoid-binding protein YceI